MEEPCKKGKYSNSNEVYVKLKAYLINRPHKAGDRVPSERIIAEDLAANRSTLRTAMQKMVREGILTRHIGVGTFFRNEVTEEASEKTQSSELNCSQHELIQMRIFLEPQIVTSAIVNISCPQVDELIAEFEDNKQLEAQKIEEFDIKFNSSLVKICNNNLLSKLYSQVIEAREQIMQVSSNTEFTALTEIFQQNWLAHQGAILKHIDNRNSKLAEKAVRKKLQQLAKTSD